VETQAVKPNLHSFALELSKLAASNPVGANKYKSPRGGLTRAGREKFRREQGSNLKPGVRGAANTPEKQRRKGSFLSRMFGPGARGAMTDGKGRPTRRALSAQAWGEAVPRDDAGRAQLYAKGQSLLKQYKQEKTAAPWDDLNPKQRSTALTPEQKARARAAAEAAGRPYPNPVDNMRAKR